MVTLLKILNISFQTNSKNYILTALTSYCDTVTWEETYTGNRSNSLTTIQSDWLMYVSLVVH